MWMDEDPKTRVSLRRIDDVIEAKADLVATACPYCLVMFEDGLKTKEVADSIHVMDLSELIAQMLPEEKQPNKKKS